MRVAGSWLRRIWIAVRTAEHVAMGLPDRLRELAARRNGLPWRPGIDLDVDVGRRAIGDVPDFLVVRTAHEQSLHTDNCMPTDGPPAGQFGQRSGSLDTVRRSADGLPLPSPVLLG